MGAPNAWLVLFGSLFNNPQRGTHQKTHTQKKRHGLVLNSNFGRRNAQSSFNRQNGNRNCSGSFLRTAKKPAKVKGFGAKTNGQPRGEVGKVCCALTAPPSCNPIVSLHQSLLHSDLRPPTAVLQALVCCRHRLALVRRRRLSVS